jgi:hypothetical protein
MWENVIFWENCITAHAELATVVKPTAIGKWLIKPNDAFDGQSAVDLIAGGKIDPPAPAPMFTSRP